MSEVLIPVSKLDAINRMLHDLGDRPVNTLSSPTRIDVVRALNSLDQTTQAFMIRGWWFNKEKMRITVDGGGKYNIPMDVVRLERISGGPNTGEEGEPFLVIRGQKLYDTVNATNVFTGAASILLLVHRFLLYEDCPSSVREYLYAAATVRNQSRTLGSEQVDSDLKLLMGSAWSNVVAEELDAQNIDMTFSPRFIDIMHRR